MEIKEQIDSFNKMANTSVDLAELKQKTEDHIVSKTQKRAEDLQKELDSLKMTLEAQRCLMKQLVGVVDALMPLMEEKLTPENEGLKQIKTVLMLASTLSNQQFVNIEEMKQEKENGNTRE